ncbi:MAG: hypothetical protein A3C93_02735 [Candidatus Lloydbacteria bacterium RIFCSPHIGHO2_02_FULL_54_17]|uniref:Type 4 fimbrial biogenesis protein PilX N-terminal domain-containing protein n=1 Tax=Candidatus Lloydbacteria bacterium RIFCSPHIGHO2_02_FULL_54_17 TaxID=1798664 RepID=A0A1G2DBC9_9BACT|nr:MAG: hypothetical protein A2762_05985 [Candidatus Lloydbacteria bacterium RIFCSPHIGHO2_01_FULL_54_11]OGZ10935.1 MAG: hypothetical protein A3C93_02735 [Candidatus Lloydbacteria bacterium RIFCSPHIGHO2_02_FULL_54_17]OGZ14916.1 MAG: hypothetical protein A2948_05330 [Candidatus Lloydbacteria bacterium RIFCSPLOWO2_01_FULL_54_18]OGZ17170.1 MAG: hypothetical protein A3H76_04130 [Candidatus Lloydbacteria bacterium RIFCSPLOWO2_02_FULL_54_12]
MQFHRSKNEKYVNGRLPFSCGGGYILLLTILVVSILLAVGLGVSAISIKEITLSAFLRDSEKALAAATNGAECALYWDRAWPQNSLQYTIFATGTLGVLYNSPPNWDTVASCNGVLLATGASWQNPVPLPDASKGITTFSLGFPDGSCVDVRVTKEGDALTTIISDGYNTCNVAMPRRTQREIAVFTSF